MKETEFNALADELVLAIEAVLDASGADVDSEISAGVLTITCESNGSKIVVSRQPALAQIWLAAKSGGFHFDYCDGAWVSTTSRHSLAEMLSRVCSEQTGSAVKLEF